MQRRDFLTAGASLGVGLVAGCLESEPNAETNAVEDDQSERGTDPETGTQTSSDGGDTDEAVIVIEEHEFGVIEENDSDFLDDDYGVSGVARNQSDERYDVALTVRYFDDQDVQIEEAHDTADGVAPGTQFTFEAEFWGNDPDNVAAYEVGWEAY